MKYELWRVLRGVFFTALIKVAVDKHEDAKTCEQQTNAHCDEF